MVYFASFLISFPYQVRGTQGGNYYSRKIMQTYSKSNERRTDVACPLCSQKSLWKAERWSQLVGRKYVKSCNYPWCPQTNEIIMFFVCFICVSQTIRTAEIILGPALLSDSRHRPTNDEGRHSTVRSWNRIFHSLQSL